MVSVINSIDTAHEDMIHDAQMDYYGVKLATCSSDRSVKIFDVQGGQHTLVTTLRGHEGPVWQLTWAHPMFGNLLASCGYDRKVIIWKETNGTWSNLYEYSQHDSSVNSVQFAPHEFGLMLSCASSDGSISVISRTGDGIWDTKKINNAHSIGCNALSWAPATSPSSLLDQTSQKSDPSPIPRKRFVSGGCDSLVKIWKEEDGEWTEEQKLDGHSDWVRDVAWAPSIGLPNSLIASCSQDCRVIIWTNDGLSNNWTSQILHKFTDVIWHVSWSITGNILAVSGGDNKVSLWKEHRRPVVTDQRHQHPTTTPPVPHHPTSTTPPPPPPPPHLHHPTSTTPPPFVTGESMEGEHRRPVVTDQRHQQRSRKGHRRSTAQYVTSQHVIVTGVLF